MRDFKTEKDHLLSDLNSEIKKNPENKILNSLNQILVSYNFVTDLNGTLSSVIIESLEFDFSIGEQLIEFENFFSDLSNSIHSTDLKRLAKLLIEEKIAITFFGNAWSENTSSWIYFDTILDLKKLRKKMSFGDNIVDHQNLDSRSGLEIGFIDQETGEGLMGKLK